MSFGDSLETRTPGPLIKSQGQRGPEPNLTRKPNYSKPAWLFLRKWKVYVLSECKSGTSSSPERRTDMSDWIHGLPLGWMAILIFGGTFLSAAVILLVVHSLAVGDRVRAFKRSHQGCCLRSASCSGCSLRFLRRRRGATRIGRKPRSTGKPARSEPSSSCPRACRERRLIYVD